MFEFGSRPELHAASGDFGRNGWDIAGVLRWVVVLGLGCGAAWGQGPVDGALHGDVRDRAGRAVAGANLVVRLAEGGAEVRVAVGARDGTFLLAGLQPGEYLVRVNAAGFAEAAATRVHVVLGETAELDVMLQRSGAAAARSNAKGNASEGAVGGPEAGVAEPDEDEDGLVSVHGLPGTQNSVLMDGAEANQSFGSVPAGAGSDEARGADDDADAAEATTGPGYGLGRGRRAGAAYGFARGAVREFRTAGQSYSAQTGHAGGGVATAVSRSGGEALHGSAGIVLRSQALAAKNSLSLATQYSNGVVATSVVKPHDLRENFEGTVGGRVPGMRGGYFFYAFDGQRRGFPAVSSPADTNFYRLTATQVGLLGNRGVTAAATDTALNYVSSLTGLVDRRQDQTIHFGRLDWQVRPRVGVGAEYNRVRWNSPAGLLSAPVVARGRASLGDNEGSLDQVLGRVTTSLGAGMANQLRLQYARDTQFQGAQTKLAQEPGVGPDLGMGPEAPEVNIGPNGLLFGTPADVAKKAYPDERRVEVADTLTMVRGHHLLQAGGSVSLLQDTVATLANGAGTFRYDSSVARGFAGGLVDFITDYTFNVGVVPNGGCPAITAAVHVFCFRSFSQSFGVDAVSFGTQEWAGFAEDTWRTRLRGRALTLQGGVRYEYTLLPLPQQPNASLDGLFGARGATSVFPEDRNNFGPRASVAYEPLGAGRGTVRAGFGLFFGRLPGETIRVALSDTAMPGTTKRVRILPTTVTGCPQVPAQGFGYPCAFATAPPDVVAATTSAVVFDRRFRLPVVGQGSFTLERELGRGTRLSVGYVLNLDRQLPSSTDLNIVPATVARTFQLRGGTGAPGVRDGETFAVPVYTSRVSPSFGPVTDVLSNANASYHALEVTGETRAGAGLRLRGSYTWSKAIDFGQNSGAKPRTNGQFDPFTNGYDKGLSALNYPWAIHGTAVWMPKVEDGRAWLRGLAGGWEVAPVVTARAGRGYSVDIFGGTRLPGGHESINGSGGALYLPTVGRNTLRLPARVNVDLRVARGFGVGARLRVRASVEASNLLNQQTITAVNQRAFVVGATVGGVVPLVFQNAAAVAAEGLNTQPFGVATGAGGSAGRERQVQFGLRAEF